MKSSSPPHSATWHAPLLAALVMLLAAGAVSWTRSGLVQRYGTLKTTHDVYQLPSPEQTVVASLGYRAALADLIFAHVLVSHGLHFQDKRLMEFVGNYLDTVTALDPEFRDPYYYADTLLVLQPVRAPIEFYVKARAILEQGMERFPHDSRLWLQAGQFIAYLGPGQLDDPEQKREWRLAGARRMARACEMLSEDEEMPFQCIAAAGQLSRQGEIEASIQFAERMLNISDNEEIRVLAQRIIDRHADEHQRARIGRRIDALAELWSKDLRFVSKDLLLVLGPPFSPARCAGMSPAADGCATSWRDWAEELAW